MDGEHQARGANRRPDVTGPKGRVLFKEEEVSSMLRTQGGTPRQRLGGAFTGCRDGRGGGAEDVGMEMSASKGAREAGQQLEGIVGFRRVVLLEMKNTRAMF